MTRDSSSDIGRRTVLKSAAVSAGVAGLGSAATAKSGSPPSEAQREELVRDYRDPAVARQAVNEQTDLLRELRADGVLPEARVDDLDTLTEPSAGVGEAVTVESFNEKHVPVVKVFRRVDAGYLSITVYPEQDTAHAVLNPVEDGEPLGEDDLVAYGETPKPMGCWSPGECQDCDCSRNCCRRDPTTGDCLQYCKQCDCSCVCCGCDPVNCPGYC